MAKYLVEDTALASVASAIREKTGSIASLVFPEGFVEAVTGIVTGGGGEVSLPFGNGFKNFASGSFTVTDYVYNITVEHNLGYIPNGAMVVCEEDVNYTTPSRIMHSMFKINGGYGSSIYKEASADFAAKIMYPQWNNLTDAGSTTSFTAYGATENTVTFGATGEASSIGDETRNLKLFPGKKYSWIVW